MTITPHPVPVWATSNTGLAHAFRPDTFSVPDEFRLTYCGKLLPDRDLSPDDHSDRPCKSCARVLQRSFP